MANYNDKKELLEKNSDLYISEFDKSLHPAALSGIIESKRSYAEAQKNNDTNAMAKANNKANTIRARFGSYSGGADGSEYNHIPQDFEIRKNTSYNSEYKDSIDKLRDKISSYGEFEYNPETDPLYMAYRSIYTKLGEDASDRAIAQNSLKSGGVNSSSAISAGVLAQNRYNSMLSAKIPELYEARYKEYADTYNRLFKELDTLTNLDEKSYSRYRDDVKDFENDRKYYSDKEKYTIDNLNDIYELDSDFEYKKEKDLLDYDYKTNKYKDEIDYKTNKYKDEIEYEKEKDSIESERFNSEYHLKELNALTALAKALYGKTPISSSVIQKLRSLIK